MADTAVSESGRGRFEIVLAFPGTECPGCGVIAGAGACSECGAEVPEPEGEHKVLKARMKALGPLAERAAALVEAFDDTPPGQVPVALDQFWNSVMGLDIISKVEALLDLGYALQELDFDDTQVVGTTIRRVIVEKLGEVELLHAACSDLALLAPPKEANEFQDLVIEAGRYGARVIERLLAALTTPAIATANDAMAELQSLLGDTSDIGRLADLIPEVAGHLGDFDERIGVVLDEPGRYTDDFGLPDIARVCGAFEASAEPLQELATRARSYFSHLLASPKADADGGETLLILPAVTMALLDQPLFAHQLALLTRELLLAADERDHEAVKALIERTTSQGPLIFAAASRVTKGMAVLSQLAHSSGIDDEVALKQVLDAYVDLAEAHFRTAGWLIRDLACVANGQEVGTDDQPPTLGVLTQQLQGSGEPVAIVFAECVDRELRNAPSHAQYRWDGAAEMMVDLRTGTCWNVAELEGSFADLLTAVAGFDAAYSCFCLDADVVTDVPRWLVSGEAPFAIALLAQAMFGAYGADVVDVSPDALDIWIAEPIEAVATLPVLAGLHLLSDAEGVMRVWVAGADEPLVAVDVSELAQATSAEEHVKDLAVLGPMLSAAAHAGGDRGQTLIRVIALQVTIIVLTADGDAGAGEMRVIGRRLRFVRTFASKRIGDNDGDFRRLLTRLERAEAAAMSASLGDGRAMGKALSALGGLAAWADSQDVQWPLI